jgi:hypothetical protein
VLFNIALRYVVRNVGANIEKLNLDDTYHFLFNVHDDDKLGDIPHCEKNTKALLVASNEVGRNKF